MWLVGVFLHIKIIKICKKDKPMTWKLDIVNSVSTLFYFGLTIVMFVFTYLKVSFIFDLCSYYFICKGIKFVIFLGRMYVCSHSLIISLVKYCMIVFHEKVGKVGKRKVEILFVMIDLFYPAISFILLFFIKKNDKFSADPYNEHFFRQNALKFSNETAVKSLFDYCTYEKMDVNLFHHIVNIIKTTTCWTLTISTFLNSINILEIILYFKIFRFMNRLV